MKKYYSLPIVIIFAIVQIIVHTSCAVIVPPSGGPKDTLPPHLVNALPKDSSLHFKENKIVLTFDEFVDVKGAEQNMIVSPNPLHLPSVEYKLREVTVKLKDSLLPNTTYTIDFGNSIKDVNEGNIAKNFSYVFSTGNYLDSGELHGKVLLANNGKKDTTLIVVLHKNLNDTAIKKNPPLYYARLDSSGSFYFKNLPIEKFAVYALESSYSKRYDDSTQMFAFLDSTVNVHESSREITLYAFQEAKRKEKKSSSSTNTTTQKKSDKSKTAPPKEIKVKLDAGNNGKQDLLSPLSISFSKKYETIDTSKIILCDTLYKKLNGYSFLLDTSQEKVLINYSWKEDEKLCVVVAQDAVADSVGNTLANNDTLRFATQKESEYGSLKFRFNDADTLKNQVLQIIAQDKIVQTIPVTSKEYQIKLFPPGDYELRVLYDKNKNGKWDTGNFKNKLQPEIVKDLKQKIKIKADWDNEFDMNL